MGKAEGVGAGGVHKARIVGDGALSSFRCQEGRVKLVVRGSYQPWRAANTASTRLG